MKNVAIALLVLLPVLLAAKPSEDALYQYRVLEVTRVYDGDTVWANLDLGMETQRNNVKIRLHGIDSPEIRPLATRKAGEAARDYLKSMIEGRLMIVETDRDKMDSFGRLIATLWVRGLGKWCPAGIYCNANAHLVEAGHAVYRHF